MLIKSSVATIQNQLPLQIDPGFGFKYQNYCSNFIDKFWMIGHNALI